MQASRIMLVTTQDPSWRKDCRTRVLGSRTYGRVNRTDDYDRLTGVCEVVFRRLLGAVLGISSPRRILKFEPTRARVRKTLFRELDAVLTRNEPDEYAGLVEIKTSVHDRRGRAREQLDGALGIASQRWARLAGVALWVDTSRLVGCEAEALGPRVDRGLQSMDELLKRVSCLALGEQLDLGVDVEDLLECGRKHGVYDEERDVSLYSAARALASKNTPREPVTFVDEGYSAPNPFAKLLAK
jgi:hypothetical protein